MIMINDNLALDLNKVTGWHRHNNQVRVIYENGAVFTLTGKDGEEFLAAIQDAKKPENYISEMEVKQNDSAD